MKYEALLRSKGLTDNSISVYMRTLRALFNKAIKEGAARKESYPFDDYKTSNLKTKANRRAITRDELRRIEQLELEQDSSLFVARQYFLFSYYCHGINFIDLALLKWKDIAKDRLVYTRRKTQKEFTIKLLPPALEILDYWRSRTFNKGEDYVFPIRKRDFHITPTQIDNRCTKVIGQTNKGLKEIGKLAGIETHLTTYVARHTFATVLKRGGVSTSIISEMMGHESESVTQTYLNSFENEVIDSAAEALL